MRAKFLAVCLLVAFSSFQSFGKGGTNAVVYTAAAEGDLVKLKQYLAADPKLLALRNSLMRTAAVHGQKEAVVFLISRGADVNEKGFFAMTPLAGVAMFGASNDEKSAGVATVLIAHGAVVDSLDDYKATPLMHAVESKKSQLTKVLLQHGADLTRRYIGVNKGMTLLHMAVLDKDKETVAVLLQFKAPVEAVDGNGATPLLMAEGENAAEIAAMIRQANPAESQGVQAYSIPPTPAEMRALAQRIAAGDEAALDELTIISGKLYGEIKNYQKEHTRVMELLSRMHAAFDLLGEEAGKGNERAFDALKKCFREKNKAFASDALGIAAAGGNKEAFELLTHYADWGVLESSARFAICVPTAANFEPAVDYSADWLLNLKNDERKSGVVDSTTNALASAAAKGSAKAQAALKEFAAVLPEATVR